MLGTGPQKGLITNYFFSFSAKPKLWEVKRSLSMVLIAKATRVDSDTSAHILLDLILYVPVNNFQSCQDRSSQVESVLKRG